MNLMMKPFLMFFVLGTIPLSIGAQTLAAKDSYWKITDRQSILWHVAQETRLPHSDHIEMSGKEVATIIDYAIDGEKNLSLRRDVIFPQLRTYNKSNEPDWKKYRAYFRRTSSDKETPQISTGNITVVPTQIDSVEIGGKLTFYCRPVNGLRLTRTIFPAMEGRFMVENWSLTNMDTITKDIAIANFKIEEAELGYKGNYTYHAFSKAQPEVHLSPGGSYSFPLYFGATLNEENSTAFNARKAWQERQDFLKIMGENLSLKTPDETINTLFYFSKIRAAESIYESSMGLVHSPGGGNYYVGIWANDQIEYSGPFFPYLGYRIGNIAAFNAYFKFLKHIPEDGSHIPYAFEVDGNFPMKHLDRGDAAMIAYGTSHYLLAQGNRKVAEQLWPLVEWSLAYCEKQRNEAGAVQSESDEMEGRIETGSANLSTSTLYYGGLKYGALLAKELGLSDLANQYEAQKKAMEQVVETYFGATFQGLETYRYFEGNERLRHWICLPLTMGIDQRKEGTLEALFDVLWTPDGILVEQRQENDQEPVTFWDRATLYALRGGIKTGALAKAYPKLKAFSEKRLLGDHVPYVVEAYPENNKRHLSAESALYCRIFTEGLLGLEPIGFDKAVMRPYLPEEWPGIELQNVFFAGGTKDIVVTREAKKLRIKVFQEGRLLLNKKIVSGEAITVSQ